MSGASNNPIINRTGSIPGATQGKLAQQPVQGAAVGDWYLATDVFKLYRWSGAAWVIVLDGSGGGGVVPVYGQIEFSATAGQTVFLIPHHLGVFPSFVNVVASSDGAIEGLPTSRGFYVMADSVNIIVTYTPTGVQAGINNIAFYWMAKI